MGFWKKAVEGVQSGMGLGGGDAGRSGQR
jgi:hypothetical protein